MLTVSILFFAIAAIFGLMLLFKVLRNEKTPRPAVFMHGLAAVTALVLLIISYFNTGNTTILASLLIFTLAAFGGIFMFSRDMAGKEFPRWLAVVHGSAAVLAFVLLLFAAFA